MINESSINTKITPERLKPFKKTNSNNVTPHVDLISIQSNDSSQRNFNSVFKQIVETNNENFLNGDLNIIDYLISKYTNTKQDDIKGLKKISIKIQSELGMLNLFGQNLPKLEELSLSGSIIHKIEDIGCSFTNLRMLNVSNCFLDDINGNT